MQINASKMKHGVNEKQKPAVILVGLGIRSKLMPCTIKHRWMDDAGDGRYGRWCEVPEGGISVVVLVVNYPLRRWVGPPRPL